MKNTFLIIGVIVVAVIGWFALSRIGQHQNPLTTPTSRQRKSGAQGKAPNFHLQDYNGKTVSLADFAGKPIIINSWASWCPFCKQEIPAFVTVQKEFGDNLVIIAIDRSESLGVAKGYTDQQGTTHDLIFLLDPSDSFYQSIGGFSMPESIFVDKHGIIVEHKRGPMEPDEIRQKVERLRSL